MNVLVLSVGIIGAFVFVIFDLISSKHFSEHKVLLILCRLIIFIAPLFFLINELKTGATVLLQYGAPFILIKYFVGVVIRSRNK